MNGNKDIGFLDIGHITASLQFFNVRSLGPLLGNFDIGITGHIDRSAFFHQQAFDFIGHRRVTLFSITPVGPIAPESLPP